MYAVALGLMSTMTASGSIEPRDAAAPADPLVLWVPLAVPLLFTADEFMNSFPEMVELLVEEEF